MKFCDKCGKEADFTCSICYYDFCDDCAKGRNFYYQDSLGREHQMTVFDECPKCGYHSWNGAIIVCFLMRVIGKNVSFVKENWQ